MRPRVLLTWLFCPSAPSFAAINISSAWACIFFQTSSSSSRTRGFPWAPTATCISLTPWRRTAARITTATPPSPNYAPSSRRSAWPSQSGAVGLLNTVHSFIVNRARRDTEPVRLLSNRQLIPDEIKAWLFFLRICLSVFTFIDCSAYQQACLLKFTFAGELIRPDWAEGSHCPSMYILDVFSYGGMVDWTWWYRSDRHINTVKV